MAITWQLALLAFCLAIPLTGSCWVPTLTQQEQLRNEVIRRTYATDALPCTPTDAKRQAERFQEQITKARQSSACAEHWWMKQLAEINLKGSQRTSWIDIGCNKGYFSATALNHFTYGHGDHIKHFYRIHHRRGIYNHSCGVCNDCKQSFGSLPLEGQRQVEVVCVEPSSVHFQGLTTVRNTLYGPPEVIGLSPDRTRVKFHVHNAAVSNKTGTARFPKACATEECNLAVGPGDYEDVAVTTVDMLTKKYGLQYVDILKIDTEGFDPAVLSGAYYSLLHHRIGALSFEYHHLWARTKASLKQCTKYLWDLGYTCFYDGPVLSKISDTCWDESYEMKWWSNIVCVARGSPLEFDLMAGTYLASMQQNEQAAAGGATAEAA